MFDFDFDTLEEQSITLMVHVHGLDGREYGPLLLTDGCTVGEVKESLEKCYDIPVFEQRLCRDFQELKNGTSLHQENGCDSCDLQLLRSVVSEAEWLQKIQQNPFALCDAPMPIKANRQVLQVACEKDVSALAYATEDLRSDQDFALDLVSMNGNALRYLCPNLRGNRDVVLLAVQSAGSMLKYASAKLKADPEIVLVAIGQDAKALMHVDLDLLHDPDFTMQAMATNRLVADYLLTLTLETKSFEAKKRLEDEVWHQSEADARDSGLEVAAAYLHFQRHEAIFLDARSVDEFDRSHIAGAVSFAERSPLIARLVQEQEDLEKTGNPALKHLVHFPNKPVVVYSDSGSNDLSLGYISRCVRVTQELRRACRRQPVLGNEKRIFRLVGGLNQWKRAGFPVHGDQRPLINDHILFEGGIHGYLNLEDDI
eukprot:symbB.v1.2.033825.t1/scaffold4256.1/size42321/2